MADGRSRSPAVIAFAANEPAGKRARTGLAVVGDGKAFQLLARPTGAPFRPQHQLGIAATGPGRIITGSGPAPRARRKHHRTDRDEVSGAGGACQCRRLRTHGRGVREAPLRYEAGGAALHSLARRLARGSRAHSRRTGAVFENAAATADSEAGSGRTDPTRPRDGACHSAPRRPQAHRSAAGDEHGAAGAGATRDREFPPRTEPHGGTNRKGKGSETC